MNFIENVKASGIVGAGGAGFPSHVKFSGEASCFIVNGIECEPLLETDKYYMRHQAAELVAGIDLIAKQIGASRSVIGIKAKNVKEIQAVGSEIEKQGLDIEIHESKNYYPAGDEQMLIKDVTGDSVAPASIPLSVGVVVSNVATVIDVYKSQKQADFAVTHRIITVTGAVQNPTLIHVPVGTSIGECIELAGGASLADFKVILGGPMMGSFCDGADIYDTYTTKTLGGIIVLAKDHHIFLKGDLSDSQVVKRASAACIQCRMCTDLCPRYLNGHPLEPHKIMRAVAAGTKDFEALKSAQLCCECGVCEMYACPMEMSPKKMNQAVKKHLSENGIRYNPASGETLSSDMRPYRQVQTDRLVARLGLGAYSHIHLDDVTAYTPKSVTIKLRQHIGAPARPVVESGQYVEVGACIGDIPDKGLGAKIHASLSGVVEVHADRIVITANQVEEEND